MSRYAFPYNLTLSVSVISVMVALQLGGLSLLIGMGFFFISRFCLSLMEDKLKEQDPYKKTAEQIAMLGILIFIPMIFTLGITSALLIFVIITQISLHLQTFEKRQFYLGLALSFALITFSASESREGVYLFLFIPYALFLSATLFSLRITGLNISVARWLKSGTALLLCTAIVYLFIPRMPALQWGSVPGSDHFYHDDNWVKKSEDKNFNEQDIDNNRDETGQALEELKDSLREFAEQHDIDLDNTKEVNDESLYDEFNERERDDFGLENNTRLNPNIVMYVRSDHPLYLTTEIFDQFDGMTWSQSQQDERYIQANQGQFIQGRNKSLQDNEFTLGYEVDIIQDLNIKVPMAWQSVGLNFPATALRQDAYGSFKTPTLLKSGTSYRAEMKASWYQGRVLYSVREDSLQRYLELPQQLDPRIEELSQTITSNSNDSLDKAILLETHLRENYSYTLDTAIYSQGRTPLSEFLFDTQFGHCEYFASAMAVMLRTVGIPSRVVTGFSATDMNPLTGFIEVRGTDAHAWTEAYFPNLGWIPFEPTAYYQLPSESSDTELTYEKVNEYAERQLEILNQQESSSWFKQVALMSWLSLVALMTWIVQSLKWLMLNHGIAIMVLISGLLFVGMLYRHLKPVWLKHRLIRDVDRYQLKGNIHDFEFYLQAIHKGLTLKQLHFSYSTIENLMEGLSHKGILMEEDEQAAEFCQLFNHAAYSQEEWQWEQNHIHWLKSTFDKVMNYSQI